MMKASLNTRYETDHKDTISGGATVAFNVGDFKLRASMTDATIKKSDATIIANPTLNGLALAIEKPGSFIIGYDVPKKDFRFQFMSSIKVLEKPLNLNYIHSTTDNQATLDGTLVFNSANKMSASHVMGSSGCKLKYSYVHAGLITFEPSYDTTKTYFDFALSRKVYKNDTVRATYKTNLYDIKDEALSGNLGLEWSRRFNQNSSFKVSASLNLAEEHKMPKLSVESSWDFDM